MTERDKTNGPKSAREIFSSPLCSGENIYLRIIFKSKIMATIEKKMTTLERQHQALNLRIQGFSYERIAQMLKYKSAQAAYETVARALQKAFIETAEEFRSLAYWQLEMLKCQISPRALAGDIKAAMLMVRIVTKEAKLMGAWGLQEDEDTEKNKNNDRYIIIWDSPENEDEET
jgi:hypothetical protein